MAAKPRIGILTGGGDVPGLNTVIKSIVYRAGETDYEVMGIRRGWMGLTHMNRDLSGYDPDYNMPLDRQATRTIDRSGGTILHTSRTNPLRVRRKELPPHLQDRTGTLKSAGEEVFDLTSEVLKNLQALGIQYLVTIGGDDTLGYSAILNQHGFPVIAIPKTMDNDVRNTEYCIGFATAITRAAQAIERQRTTVASHERIGIFRIFGRDAGFTALHTAYVTAARCLIPEYPFNLEKLSTLLMEDKRENPSHYALVIISEGATWNDRAVMEYGDPDAFKHRKKLNIGEALAEELKQRTGQEMMISDLTYDLRSGPPDFLDKLIATTFANMAMDLIQDRQQGVMTAIQGGKYTRADIPSAQDGPRKVDIASMYNTARFRPDYSRKLGLPIFLEKS